MNKNVDCPHCGITNTKTEEVEKDLNTYGKACINCDGCDKLFTVRDDGDREYTA